MARNPAHPVQQDKESNPVRFSSLWLCEPSLTPRGVVVLEHGGPGGVVIEKLSGDQRAGEHDEVLTGGEE